MNELLENGLNLELTCRFCLNDEFSDLTSISESIEINCQNQAINLQHAILTCIGIGDCLVELPKWICKECISQLAISYTFREKCLQTIKYLNDILVKRESESPSLVQVVRSDYCELVSQFGIESLVSYSNSNSDTAFQAPNIKPNQSNSIQIKKKSTKWMDGHFHRTDYGPFKCDICASLLKSRRTLLHHMRTLHISLIDSIPEKQSDLTESKPTANPGDNDTLFPFKCDICGSGLKSNFSIRDHMQKFHIANNDVTTKRSVSAVNPLECEICRNGYPNRKSLSRHRIRVHGIFKGHKPLNRLIGPKKKSEVKRWQICPICGVMRKDMKCHIATHQSGRLFKCEICGSDLKTAVNLKRHLRRVHTEDRQYPCNLCNVAFKAPFQLKRHNRKHTQERNYGCNFCEKRFIDKATLDRHFVVHFRVRNVECNFCGKLFQSNLGLQNHIGIHTLEKKFKCGLCSLAFITSSAASVHRRTHRNELDNHFHCGDCGMKFQEVIMLKMHLRAVGHRFSVEKN